MAHPEWSAVSPALPETYVLGSWAPGFATRFTEFPTDRGPAPRRARFAAAIRVEAMEMHLTTTQLTALQTFFETTLSGGALAFLMFDPGGGTDRLVRFAAAPAPNFLTPKIWRVRLSLEVLP